MAVIEPFEEKTFYRVCEVSGEISADRIAGLYPTHAAALEASRIILERRRRELQDELSNIDAMLPPN